MSKSRSRAFAFTLNNPTSAEGLVLEDMISEYPKIRYFLMGKESGANAQTPHWQGYLYFKKKISWKKVKKMVGFERVHLESAKGSPQQNMTYCKKEGKWKEFGDKPKQGNRNDLCEVRTMVSKFGMRAVTRTANFQQIRVAEKYLNYNEIKRKWKMEVVWIWGDTGIGKSRLARAMLESVVGDDVYTKSEGSKWWPGYDAHKGIIIDDFRPSWWMLTYMLRLLDRYACPVENKGGDRQVRATHLIVTSIKSPRDIYNGDSDEPHMQLMRRITKVIHMDDPFDVFVKKAREAGGV